MRIAQVAPLFESVPPSLYGGTERVVSYLTEQLVALGHDVTLFASGDSRTSARLVPCVPRALRVDTNVRESLPHQVLQLERVRQQAHQFDIIHSHVDYLHFPLSRGLRLPMLTTMHGRLDLPDHVPLFREFAEMALSSISMAQRRPLPFLNWVGNVPHGLPINLLRPMPVAERSYLAFLGRICPEKRPDLAIRIAEAAKLPLRIAAKVDRVDIAYFEDHIRPLLSSPLVAFTGEIGDSDKGPFLGHAKALLFPIDWPEPFGLVMIEAMACGTPVIALRRGSVAEVIEHGLTGFVIDTVEQAVAAVGRLGELDPMRIRARFQERFTARRMAKSYLRIYDALYDALQWSSVMAHPAAVARTTTTSSPEAASNDDAIRTPAEPVA
jgi:glycosyltransferase involved in cell wall biosynthesis